MIQNIRLLLEYQTYPLWLLDEAGNIIKNDLPEEWKDDIKLDNILTELMDKYSELFINTPTEFRFMGFKDSRTKLDFEELSLRVKNMLVRKNNGKYQIIDDLNLENM